MSDKKWSNGVDEEQFDVKVRKLHSSSACNSNSVKLKSSTSIKPVYSTFIHCTNKLYSKEIRSKYLQVLYRMHTLEFAVFPFSVQIRFTVNFMVGRQLMPINMVVFSLAV